MPKSAGIAFALHFYTLHVVTYLKVYRYSLMEYIRNYSLKEHETVLLKRENLIFSIAAGSTLFVFLF